VFYLWLFCFISEDLMSVSVIIPTLNEASCLAATLASLREQQPHEIIVVDGGSQDATCEIACAADLVLHSPPGRARQMNLGVAHAMGDILLFLHADCELEASALEVAENSLSCRNAVAGCFTMQVRASGLLYRWIDAWASARVRLTGMIYGDQGLFLSRQDFLRLGEFPELRLMEDVFFSRTLSRQGRIVVAPKRIFVSPRRWQRTGLIRQTLRNWLLTGLAAGGVHPDRLARFYFPVR
jgi:rSAM/selenodomain-associated transferase 2